MAEERALREKMAREFSMGKELRLKEIAEFQTVLQEKQAERKIVDEQLENVKEQLVEVESALDQVKHEYMQQRVNTAKNIAQQVAMNTSSESTNDSLTGLLEPLANGEIMELIVHSCQMAGEMERASLLDDSTCVALRLAGLDAALIWSQEKDGSAKLKRLHMNVREEGKLLADLMMDNAVTEKDEEKHYMEDKYYRPRKHRKRNTKRTKHGRRRLQAVSDSDDEAINDDHFPDDYIEENDDYMYGEEMHDSDDAEVDQAERNENDNVDQQENSEKGIIDILKESLFSQPRVAFLQRSQEIISAIDELLKDDDSDKEKKDEEAEEASAEKKPIDPAAYNMVRATLEDREEAIERGYDNAVSAKILLNALSEATEDQDRLREDLLTLAVGTLVYGKLSVVHVWQIFQAILPEFNQSAEDSGNKEKTCATSPWVASCPPRSVVRNSVSFPPQLVLDIAQVLCTTPTFTQEKAQACAADADNELPTVMPDGYYGYEVVNPREASDPLEKIAAEWDPPLSETSKTKLDELESNKSKLEGDRKNIEKSAREISDLVEGAQEARFGIDGELYALKDKCFSVKAGKYTYEACIFGSAAQKEGDEKSGTSLGQWDSSSYEEETGKRILKWTNGIKCWNGPHRSATAYVTCGAETKVLSADEPDTCRYVLQMESHIACDDAFRDLHEL